MEDNEIFAGRRRPFLFIPNNKNKHFSSQSCGIILFYFSPFSLKPTKLVYKFHFISLKPKQLPFTIILGLWVFFLILFKPLLKIYCSGPFVPKKSIGWWHPSFFFFFASKLILTAELPHTSSKISKSKPLGMRGLIYFILLAKKSRCLENLTSTHFKHARVVPHFFEKGRRRLGGILYSLGGENFKIVQIKK